jgi:hypothetical protein
MDLRLGLISIFGITGLSGVVANDSLGTRTGDNGRLTPFAPWFGGYFEPRTEGTQHITLEKEPPR